MAKNPLKDITLQEVLKEEQWWQSPENVQKVRKYYRMLHVQFGEEEIEKAAKKEKKTKDAAAKADSGDPLAAALGKSRT
jgi:hypothetical protein